MRPDNWLLADVIAFLLEKIYGLTGTVNLKVIYVFQPDKINRTIHEDPVLSFSLLYDFHC